MVIGGNEWEGTRGRFLMREWFISWMIWVVVTQMCLLLWKLIKLLTYDLHVCMLQSEIYLKKTGYTIICKVFSKTIHTQIQTHWKNAYQKVNNEYWWVVGFLFSWAFLFLMMCFMNLLLITFMNKNIIKYYSKRRLL